MHSARSLTFARVGAALWLVVAFAPSASGGESIAVEVMVSRISDASCQTDARAERLDRKLRSQFRYECIEVLEEERLELGMDQVGAISLPTGKHLRIRLLDRSEKGVLLAVEVEGVVNTDLRVRSGHLVAIGGGRHEGGKLVISLEPRY